MPNLAWFTPRESHLDEARRLTALRGMTDTCAIKAYLESRNARGDVVGSREIVRATGVPCRLARFDVLVAGTESGGVYGRSGDLIDTSAAAYQLFLPWGTDIRQSDHVELAGGDKYEVQSADADSTLGVEVVARLVKLGIDNPQEGD
jgi:hypothetical protein